MLDAIPYGREHAVSREALSVAWRMDQRKVRRHIAILRRLPAPDGSVILSSSSAPGGYWRSRDPVEIKRFIQEADSRAKHLRDSTRQARKALRMLEEQKKEEGDQLSFLDGDSM